MDTTLADPLVGRLLDGRYRVESRIARGGMATVYVALDIRLDRTVALKVMHRSLAEDPSFVRRFIGEAKSVASLSHPNVVQVFDQGADGDIVYLSMEYVPGRTLRDALRERGRLTPRESLEIVIPVLAALSAAHQKSLIHRDVKPENVLLAEDGRVKVVDFGLARAVEASNQTRTGVMIGTIGYMSPEQVTTGRTDARSDVYSAGIMLFELITGRQPYDGDAPMTIAYKHVHDTVPPPSSLIPDIPPALDALVSAATSRAPEERPADAGALLIAAVEAHRALASDSVPPTGDAVSNLSMPGTGAMPRPTAHPPTQPPPPAGHTLIQPRPQMPERARRRVNPFLVALGVVMVAAVAFTGWFFSQSPPLKVPELRGKNIDIARSQAESRGFAVVIGEGVHDGEVTKDSVLRTDPVAGIEVDRGARLTLIPSLGPKMVAVPDLTGVPEGTARERLSQLGLKVDDVHRRESDTVQRGLVLSSNPKAGGRLREGGKVDITLSAGLLMPDLMGLPRDQAEQWLREQGFQFESKEQTDDAEPCTVIAQDPRPKAEIDKTVRVSLTLSQCNVPFQWPWETGQNNGDGTVLAIPNVLYKNVADAQRELQAAGFKVRVRKLRMGGGIVRGQLPLSGQQAPRGTRVTIWY
ncbi:Stk1 family PASTA domain-containing Ser/Thr kinase [Spongiactinospora sp. TRM90649]|uniref:Stk1 family PASTA domain-containing Ser/Thr kinase n=1 Tax=Spongiactinospora sp. TRM90649 TaxID=3031114 RepID=UPI0023F8DD59|nr:Stk1 family PASTA domain-containing Ser/Thr kinase [Spongiactinospora sp. TRM90649]MDF5756781.1 Stk1 family PASTA domain-containing Ser/Thr kinase [Spongiactinospora sp. TRM90649]